MPEKASRFRHSGFGYDTEDRLETSPSRTRATVSEVGLSAGTIEYEDTGGGGPAVVLLHGPAMDGSLWRNVVADQAFDNYPPGLPGKTVALFARLPGGLNALAQPMRLRALRRLPFALG